jgi:large subunit ribosomal protein L10
MPLPLESKQVIVEQMRQTAQEALSMVVANSRGIDSNSMNELRHEAYKNKVVLRVVKNSLAKRALSETPFECVNEHLKGPSVFGFSMDHPGAAAKMLRNYAKQESLLEIKLFSIDGEFRDGKEINTLADMPTRDEALAMFMRVSLAPLNKTVLGLNDILARFVRVTARVAEVMESRNN